MIPFVFHLVMEDWDDAVNFNNLCIVCTCMNNMRK